MYRGFQDLRAYLVDHVLYGPTEIETVRRGDADDANHHLIRLGARPAVAIANGLDASGRCGSDAFYGDGSRRALSETGMNPNETKPTMAMSGRPKRGVPEGLWIRCPQCKATVFRKEAESRLNVCPECEYHFYLPARERIAQLLDEESFEEWFTDLRAVRPAGLQGPHSLRRAAASRAGQDRDARRGGGRPRLHPRPAGGVRRHRLRLHGRQHGFGGRREADARRRGSDAACSCR